MTSSNNPLAQSADQAPAGLDDLLASVRSDDEEKPSRLRRYTQSNRHGSPTQAPKKKAGPTPPT